MARQDLHLKDYKCPGSVKCPGKKADLWNGLSVDIHSKDAILALLFVHMTCNGDAWKDQVHIP